MCPCVSVSVSWVGVFVNALQTGVGGGLLDLASMDGFDLDPVGHDGANTVDLSGMVADAFDESQVLSV